MEVFALFGIAGLIIFIGFLGELIFSRTNIPDVIWLMLVGIIINIFTRSLISDAVFSGIAPIFTTFALIFILFEGAININIKQFLKGIISGVSLTVNSFILSSISVAIIMTLFFGWSFLESLLLGVIIGGSSSAIVIPIVKKLPIGTNATLILTIESAISDVLCIVSALTIINIIDLNKLLVESVFQEVLYSFIVAAALGTFAGLLWIKIQNMFQRFSKSYMTTIAYLLIIFSFVEYVKSNGAIACLFFGLVFGNSKKIMSLVNDESHSLMTPSAKFFYSEISFFVKSFFFVYLGMIIDFTSYYPLLIGFFLSLILLLVRPLAVLLTAKKKTQKKDRIYMEILAPKGLAAAVLAQLPLQYGLENAQVFTIIVSSVIFFSIMLSTILIYFTEQGRFQGVRLPKMDALKNIKITKEKTLGQELDEHISHRRKRKNSKKKKKSKK